jgi:rubrerythrin
MLRTFIGFKEDTISFYQVLKTLVDDPATAAQLDRIISEERKHIVKFDEMLSNIRRFATDPGVA